MARTAIGAVAPTSAAQWGVIGTLIDARDPLSTRGRRRGVARAAIAATSAAQCLRGRRRGAMGTVIGATSAAQCLRGRRRGAMGTVIGARAVCRSSPCPTDSSSVCCRRDAHKTGLYLRQARLLLHCDARRVRHKKKSLDRVEAPTCNAWRRRGHQRFSEGPCRDR